MIMKTKKYNKRTDFLLVTLTVSTLGIEKCTHLHMGAERAGARTIHIRKRTETNIVIIGESTNLREKKKSKFKNMYSSSNTAVPDQKWRC